MTYTTSSIAFAGIDQMFHALNGILDKAAAHAKTAGVEETVYTTWRLAPDMFAMAKQVQIATEIAARGLTRLSGAEPPSYPDTETTFAQLKERIAKAHAHIKDLDKAKIDSDPDGDITFPLGQEKMTMKRRQYLMNFVLPNVYFHTTAAYLNLRNAGVPLGKSDFLAR
ncbi:MAG: DUF1993 domain-containing protein [Pseudomonadota bacterium]